jgi:myo-inositol-1-phosphate synthase
MNTIRVAIIGVGNCASSPIQGGQYSRDAKETGFPPDPAHRHRGPRTDR